MLDFLFNKLHTKGYIVISVEDISYSYNETNEMH